MSPTGNYDKKKVVERETNRILPILYDLVVFIVCAFIVEMIHSMGIFGITTQLVLMNVFFAAFCVFAARLLFGVYKQIWRFAYPRAFLRLAVADIVGGFFFLTVIFVSARIRHKMIVHWFFQFLTLLLMDLIAVILSRIAYYYCYSFAKQDTPFGRSLKRFLRYVALVDVDSDEPGALLELKLESAERSGAPINDTLRVARQFAIRGEIQSIVQINKGYINRTYRVETLSETGHTHLYTLQRVNTNIFTDMDALMENYKFVTDHLHGKFHLEGSTEKGSVTMVRVTKDGRSYHRDDSGCWRMMSFFDNTYSMDLPDSHETFYYAGKSFGSFIRELSDIDIKRIHTVIPNFHNTLSRYLDLEAAIAADPVGRVKDVEKEISFIRARKNRFGMIADRLEDGTLPTRICHNDCNLNNILFDKVTHLPVAVIDLDTVMPSSPLYDYGDSMRIGTNTAVDDEKDLSKVSCDLSLYERYARGWLESCGDILTKEELELLPYASLIITSEDGIRFLMDYINGDTYYNIFYPEQNLDRARTQLALVSDMETKLPKIKKILAEIYHDLGIDQRIGEIIFAA